MKIFIQLILFFFITSLIYSQNNITNTLGAGGTFTIKDGSTTFFTLNQSDGRIILPVTTNPLSLGVIFKGNSRFLHDFAPNGSDGFNTFVGVNSGNFTMSAINPGEASYNTGIGNNTLLSLTTGLSNTASGSYSLFSNTTGSYNTASGSGSLYSNTTGSYNTVSGSGSLYSNTTGNYNTATGNTTLYFNTTGYSNTATGFGSLFKNTTGFENTATGSGSLYSNTTGDHNTASGYNSLYWNTTGEGNTASGYISLNHNTTGSLNTASGSYSLFSNTTGYENTASGSYSLFTNMTGNDNTASGFGSLYWNTTGSQNTASGANSLLSNTTGINNTAFGYNALRLNTTGFHNTAVGHHSLENNTGNYNTALGYNAGSTVTTGANLTLLGIDANPSSPTAVDQITLGNGFVTSLRCNVQNISSLSDERDKKNIKELDLGIDFLMQIKPRLFNWDKREWYEDNKSDGSKTKEEPTAGFIAQELDEVQTTENAEWLNLVLNDNPEKLEATPGNLLPIIVKAIQDLKKENDELKIRLTKLQQAQNILVTEIENLKINDSEITKVGLGD